MHPYPLWLMRHGQTEWNAEGRMQGRLNSPLTELGQAQAGMQAALMAPILEAHPEATLWTSPQGRARQTAAVVCAGRDVVADERLCEISVGEFEGHLIEELRPQFPEVFEGDRLAWYDRAPGGEGLAALRARSTSFLSELSGPAVVICHGITLRMLRMVAMDMDTAQLEEMPVRQGAVHFVNAGRHEMLGDGTPPPAKSLI